MKSKWLFFLILPLLGLSCNSPEQTTGRSSDFDELPDPTVDTLSDWSHVGNALQASFVSIDKRYPKSLAPEMEISTKTSIVGWKGEKLAAQVLLWTSEARPNVRVQFSDFEAADGKLPASIAEARFVRYVMTDEFRDGCGYRKPEDFAASLSPDMLDDLDHFDLEQNKVRPVWLSVHVPSDAQAGSYTATVDILEGSKVAKTLELELEVINQSLPAASEWSFHLDQWQHPSAVARTSGVEMWSDAHFAAMRPTMKMLADVGQKVITATLNKDPWNVQTFDPYADMIVWTKNEDETWSYDYAVFDRWITFMMDLGIKDMINCYSIIPWNNEIHYKDAATGEFVDVVAKPGTSEFDKMWRPFLADFVEHLSEKGWLEITNIAIDERDRESMDAAFKLLNEVGPSLGISFADNQKTYQRYPDSRDISVAAQHPFDHDDLLERTAKGLNTTYYVYCGNDFPNQFTFSDPAESTYLAWYALAAEFNGVLHWAFNSWVENPLQDSRFRTWPAGDTYIVYPNGRSSIRYERMLEGIQDYEKALIVSAQLESAGDTEALGQLNDAIEKLNNPHRRDGWNEELNTAKQLLNELSKKTANAA